MNNPSTKADKLKELKNKILSSFVSPYCNTSFSSSSKPFEVYDYGLARCLEVSKNREELEITYEHRNFCISLIFNFSCVRLKTLQLTPCDWDSIILPPCVQELFQEERYFQVELNETKEFQELCQYLGLNAERITKDVKLYNIFNQQSFKLLM